MPARPRRRADPGGSREGVRLVRARPRAGPGPPQRSGRTCQQAAREAANVRVVVNVRKQANAHGEDKDDRQEKQVQPRMHLPRRRAPQAHGKRVTHRVGQPGVRFVATARGRPRRAPGGASSGRGQGRVALTDRKRPPTSPWILSIAWRRGPRMDQNDASVRATATARLTRYAARRLPTVHGRQDECQGHS